MILLKPYLCGPLAVESRRFGGRGCAKSGVLAEVRRREHYESPSVKRRKKSEAARKNRKKYY